jgi:DNA-binding transcriptional MerR regulator
MMAGRATRVTIRLNMPRGAYTIGQLARLVGVRASTLRFYERCGLLAADFRTAGNYRAYTESALRRLRFIRTAQNIGLSLTDIKELLGIDSANDLPCDEVNSLLKNRLRDVRGRITRLRKIERSLSKSRKDCCRGNEPDLCRELVRLGTQKDCEPSTRNKIAIRA